MALLDVLDNLDNSTETYCHSFDSVETCKCYLNSSKLNFTILSLNIRSIQRNFDNFLVTLKRLDSAVDIIVLTECWLSDGLILNSLPGYNVIRSSSPSNKSGGVVIYIKSCHRTELLKPMIVNADNVVCTINDSVTVLGIYRSPSISNTIPFLESLDYTLTNLKHSSSIILIGDINIDICCPLDGCNSEYLSLMASHGLLSVISKPTRGKACLDHIFIKTKSETSGIVCKSSVTDHDIVIAGLRLPKRLMTNKSSRLKKKIDIEAAATEINNSDWSPVFNSPSLNTAIDNFVSIMSKACEKHTRTTKVSRTMINIKPWITPGLIRCSHHRDRLHSYSRAHPDDAISRKIYTRYHNFYISLLRKIKVDYNASLISENISDPKKLWKSIKIVSGTSNRNNNNAELLHSCQNIESSLNNCNHHFA